MFEEQTDQYLIHSNVFSSIEDETNNEQFLKNSIQISILFDKNNGNITVKSEDNLNLCRLERMDLSLGI